MYVADELYYNSHGQTHQYRWVDEQKPKQPDKSADEIIDDIVRRVNGE